MADKKDERPKLSIITPKGTAIYPKLNTPSDRFNPAGVYEAKIKFDPTDAVGLLGKEKATWADIVDAIQKQQDEFLAEVKKKLLAGDGKSKLKAKKIEVAEFGEVEIDDDENETGNIIIKAKMVASGVNKKTKKPWTRKPDIFDARGRKLEDPPMIWGGSELKLAVEAVPYYMPKENTVGTSLYLNGCQVITLVTGSGSRDAGAYGFGEEEGYEADPDAEGGSDDAEDDDIPF